MAAGARTVIVGASLAGARAAEALRDAGFQGEVVLVGAEPHLPYDRPPLSKGFLGGGEDSADIGLLSPSRVEELGLDLRLGRPATALEADRRTVVLGDGAEVSYDQLVIATGSEAVYPRAWPRLEGVHTLRTIEDATRLREDLGGSLVVVGAGFIGCEVAATARAMGASVTLIEMGAAPLARVLGDRLGSAFADYHAEAGVDVRVGVGVEGFEGERRVEGVLLSDGSRVAADLVLVGVGARPAVDWLRGSGLDLADGVLCNAACATPLPGVYAAGDVARWQSPFSAAPIRVEHWTNASAQGAFVGRAIAGEGGAAFETVPFVWSEQLGMKLELAGLPSESVQLVEGSFVERRFVALYERDGRLSGAVAVDSPRSLLRFRRLLARRGSWAEALAEAERAGGDRHPAREPHPRITAG
jgi:NADPH-dependent 2,4-dienoyl-CoA reductase/sulfur reductase-like enzyme